MKCFCDIPLECLEDHIKTYGQYGVAFNKAWGVKIGLTPVIYYNQNSSYVQNMREIYNDYICKLSCETKKAQNNESNNLKDKEDLSNLSNKIRILKSSFTMYKPIQGKYERRPECGDNYSFYDEREWRYLLPAITCTAYLQGDNFPQDFIDYYNGVEKDGKWQKGKLEKDNQIEFTFDDIDFVIVPSTCDKNRIIKQLNLSVSETEYIKKKIATLDELTNKTNT
jgi:hypothetical protein